MVRSRSIKRLPVAQDESGLLLDPREAIAALAVLEPANNAEPEQGAPYVSLYLNLRTTARIRSDVPLASNSPIP